MPELPEVETIVRDLKKIIPGLKITGVWSDIPAFQKIKKEVVKPTEMRKKPEVSARPEKEWRI